MTSKERFMSVIQGKTPDRVPVFPLLMEFASSRFGANYRQFASDGGVMAQSQLKMLDMFKIDAITACTDAFRITADLGAEMVFPDNKPPYSARPLIKSRADFERAKNKRPDANDKTGRMYDRAKGVAEMARSAGHSHMVLGWVDMPFAEACSVCGVQDFLMMLYDEPGLAHDILDFLTGIVTDFALIQLDAGAAMTGAGDAAASLVSPELYREFVLPYEKRVTDAIHGRNSFVKLHICGNTAKLINDMIDCGADLYNVDHLVDFGYAAELYGKAGKAFKGNLDPVGDILQAKAPEEVCEKARNLVRLAKGKKYMLSAGCEIPAAVSDEVFAAFCAAAGKG
ncbi:MAG: uroporphyrinogen decarboxylase family protein [Firmicutes bacterium]|nr:uroporphyrinogen decarboxylase family protein [Bacillota bacterium]